MLGVVVGDIVGSVYEWDNIKSKNFELFDDEAFATDDSIMTLAVCKALMQEYNSYEELSENTIKAMQELGRKYPDAGYGYHFEQWLNTVNPKPYNSYGNGSAMRVSACGLIAKTPQEVKELSAAVTRISHNHPEGMKGAEATAMCVYYAKHGMSQQEMREFVNDNYYPMDFVLDDIREKYEFEVSCQGTVPAALQAFFEAKDFEDAIRNAISIGGDSDTIAAITGAVAGAYFPIPDDIANEAKKRLDTDLSDILNNFEKLL